MLVGVIYIELQFPKVPAVVIKLQAPEVPSVAAAQCEEAPPISDFLKVVRLRFREHLLLFEQGGNHIGDHLLHWRKPLHRLHCTSPPCKLTHASVVIEEKEKERTIRIWGRIR